MIREAHVMIVLDVGRNYLHVAFVVVIGQVIGNQRATVGQFRNQFRFGAMLRFWRCQQLYRGFAVTGTIRHLDDGNVGGGFAR